MASPYVIRGQVFEEQWPTVCARVVDASNTVILNADIVTGVADTAGTGIDLYVYDESPGADPTTAVYTSFGNASSSFIYDALQTDGYWEGEDEVGYSFRATLDMTEDGLVANAGHKYLLEYRINMTSGGPIYVVAAITFVGAMHT